MNDRRRVLIVQNSPGSGPGRLPGWLAEEGLDAEVVPGEALPESLDDVDALVLLGGGLMPTDDERAPFLARERALVGEAIADEVPVFGICLGAQVIAHVAGGVVTPKSGETERGSCPVVLLPAATDDALFAGLVDRGELRMVQSHEDSITALPPGAVQLATSDACRVQAFRLGSVAWGVQFHPEAATTRIADWDGDKLAAKGFDKAAMVAQGELDADTNAEQARALIGAFAAVVRETSD